MPSLQREGSNHYANDFVISILTEHPIATGLWIIRETLQNNENHKIYFKKILK